MSTKRTQKSYDSEFKAQAVKLAQEIGGHKAAKELGVPDGTIYCWIKAFKEGRLSANEAVHTPKTALSLNDELIELRKRVKEKKTNFSKKLVLFSQPAVGSLQKTETNVYCNQNG